MWLSRVVNDMWAINIDRQMHATPAKAIDLDLYTTARRWYLSKMHLAIIGQLRLLVSRIFDMTQDL